MIEVEGLTKRYGEFTAVDHIDFTAGAGEIVGLLGANGAGKTTTMRMLTGFMPPTDGRAEISGHDVVMDSMAARRCVGYLPERVPVYPDMTVGDYVRYWAALRGAKAPRAQTDAALKKVNLYDRRNTLIRKLSKGMRQRLGLAQAVVHNPPVIILDEPTIGIDPQQVIEVRESVRALGKDHTVLFSTHILSEAEQVCDRVLILHQGRIVASGSPAQLRERLQAGGGVYVEIGKAARADAERLLRGVPGVKMVKRDGMGFALTAEGSADEDLRTRISERVSAAGYPLLEMRAKGGSLEAVYLQIVGESQADDAREVTGS